MKRFFIFAAMLLTIGANAGNLNDDPPVVKPGSDHIVLTPRDMMDKDRSMSFCTFTYDTSNDILEFTCCNTGNYTEILLLDRDGNEIGYASIDSDLTSVAVIETPDAAGTYYIVLSSEKYYGEATLYIN